MNFFRWNRSVLFGNLIVTLGAAHLFAAGFAGGARMGGGMQRPGGGYGGGMQRPGGFGGEGMQRPGGGGAGMQRPGGGGMQRPGGGGSPSFSHPGNNQRPGNNQGFGGRGEGEGPGRGNFNNNGNRGNSNIGNRGNGNIGNRGNGNSQSGNNNRNGNQFNGGNRNGSGNTYNGGNNTINSGYHPNGNGYGNGYNHPFYNGSCYGHGAYGYGAPLAWGAMGLGALAYGSGYNSYYNPYASGAGYGSTDDSNYNYSQPLPVGNYAANYSDDPNGGNNSGSGNNSGDAGGGNPQTNNNSQGNNPAPSNDSGSNTTDSSPGSSQDPLDPAIAAFKQRDYDKALDLVNKAILRAPQDQVMHEFRGLVLFANQDYRQAAATIHAALSNGPGWDWTTMSSLYNNIDTYTGQLRMLQTFVKNHADDGAAHFLLGYHYLVAGNSESAAEEFQQVVKLVPNDSLAAQILKMVSHSAGASSDAPAAPSAASQTAANPVDPTTMTGNWTANRNDGSKFELDLGLDSSFTWKFTQKGKTSQFGGSYAIDGNTLTLNRANGGALVGTVTPGSNGGFNFKLVGGPETDTGLSFGH